VPEPFRSGYVSIVGRPNVGKSTILNALLGMKVAIVSDKPQTTRNRILGVKTLPEAQIIFFDTPGLHTPKDRLSASMVRTAKEALKEMDLVLFVTDPGRHERPDQTILDDLRQIRCPVILAINKIDTVKKSVLLPMIAAYTELFPFREIIPLSALRGEGTGILLERITEYLPEGPKYYPDETVTDQMERFMAAEIIREKLMERTRDEVPHAVAVEVTDWAEREDGLVSVSAVVYVEREGQKGIIIGDKGRTLKSVGRLARLEMEKLLGTKVFLQVWVKVRKSWRDDARALHELGYL
jgi:GTP-binding protein Era